MDPMENNRKPISRIKSPSVLSGDIGKLPPQAIEIEQVILGAMMLEKSAIDDCVEIINQNSFYDPKHQIIFKTIRDLFASTNPVDLEGKRIGFGSYGSGSSAMVFTPC